MTKTCYYTMTILIRQMLDYAVEQLEIITVNPFRQIKLQKKMLRKPVKKNDESQVFLLDETPKIIEAALADFNSNPLNTAPLTAVSYTHLDNTALIADEYEARYPGICRAIHQENGGHGEAVNAGLREASGIYFKVVDSDDWVNEEAYAEVLKTLRDFVMGNQTLDMLITNFVYEKQGAKHKRVMQYKTALPKRQLCTWKDVKMFMLGQYILMHSVVYRTEMLKGCGLELPKHTFYVDNIFVFQPLPYVKTFYYLDVNFYRYFIGREDQSVNEQVMIGRIDQQIRVTKLMLGYYHESKITLSLIHI